MGVSGGTLSKAHSSINRLARAQDGALWGISEGAAMIGQAYQAASLGILEGLVNEQLEEAGAGK